MKVYITQYALTKGILEEEAEIEDGCAYTKGRYSWRISKTHWFSNREDAVIRCNDLKNRQIATFQKGIDKLKKLSFE